MVLMFFSHLYLIVPHCTHCTIVPLTCGTQLLIRCLFRFLCDVRYGWKASLISLMFLKDSPLSVTLLPIIRSSSVACLIFSFYWSKSSQSFHYRSGMSDHMLFLSNFPVSYEKIGPKASIRFELWHYLRHPLCLKFFSSKMAFNIVDFFYWFQ